MVLRGIDVSNHQGVINWPMVRAHFAHDFDTGNTPFVFMKASEGVDYTDIHFKRNWEGAHKQGFVCGVYHFPQPELNADARDEADYFWSVINSLGGLLTKGDMLVFDGELRAGVPAGDYGNWSHYWMQIIESYFNVKPLMYTSTFYVGQMNLSKPEFANYGLWQANYIMNWSTLNTGNAASRWPKAPAPWPFSAFWQYTDKGTVSGIQGPVDLNFFNGNVEELLKYGFQQKEPAPEPTPIDVVALEQHLKNIDSHLNEIEVARTKINNHAGEIALEVEDIRKLLE